jgi:hypothetical protein
LRTVLSGLDHVSQSLQHKLLANIDFAHLDGRALCRLRELIRRRLDIVDSDVDALANETLAKEFLGFIVERSNLYSFLLSESIVNGSKQSAC